MPQRTSEDEVVETSAQELLQKYLEAIAREQTFSSLQARQWALLHCYAEVQFILHGGRRCPVCNAHVRHVLPVTAERHDGTQKEFACLCTRCFEAERAVSRRLVTHLLQLRVEHHPAVYGANTIDRRSLMSSIKKSKTVKK